MRNFVVAVSLLSLFGSANLASAQVTVLDAAQRAADAAERAAAIVPKGAVMAFNLEGCPTGWLPLSQAHGRVIVGVGEGNRDEKDKLLTSRALGDVGGVESHILTENEMPIHTHIFTGGSVTKGGNHGVGRVLAVGDGAGHGNYTPTGTNSSYGGSGAHPNMPPFLSLLICEKT
ncbi:hypothetical protein [uncultured Roseobacter sp.]|uniref:phage tail protein n=1 Tax=uncultured Roseobacter sp. TaxID=114847 RepID=UPI00262C7D50|nr:hypothetical protein [uncultured Roseobacter sp.]